jgi:hypothetical protein
MEADPSGAHWTGDKASSRGSMDGVEKIIISGDENTLCPYRDWKSSTYVSHDRD